MYITNSGNIGMATLLQQNKATCMKTLINGGGNGSSNVNTASNVNNTGIVVGSIVSGVGVGTSQVGGTVVATSGGSNIGSLTTGGVGGNLVLSAGQAIVLTNGATGASSIINYQQYQQLLQQQHQQQQQQQQINSAGSGLSSISNTTAQSGTRVLMPHEMVTLPISSIVTTSGGGLALITSANTAGGSATSTQGHFLVAATASPSVHPIQTTTMGTSSGNISSFQQQFQQQIAAHNTTTNNNVVTSTPNSRATTTIYTQQPVATSIVSTVPTTRYFSQFSNHHQQQQQQQPTSNVSTVTATPTIVATKATGNRTTHVLINRSNNTIIAGNTTQRLQHAKILNKPPTNMSATSATVVSNAIVAGKSQINHNSHTPAIQTVKLQQQQQQQQPPRQNIAALQQIRQQIQPQQQQQQQKIQLVKPIVHSSNPVTVTATKTTTVAYMGASSRNLTSGALINGGLSLVPNSNSISINKNNINNNKSGNITAVTLAALPAKILSTASILPQQQQQQQQQQKLQLQVQQQLNQNQNQQRQTLQQRGQSEEHKQIVAHSRTIPATPLTAATTPATSTKTANSIVDPTSAGTASIEDGSTEAEVEPEIDIVINNVVCSFSVRCHLNLRDIALKGLNVEYRRENGMVTMKLRRPYTTASIWSSGRITCTGATSEEQAKIAARRYARCLQNLGFRARFHNFRVVNVLGTCSMPWAIKILNFSERFKKEASYEPELHPGVTYKLRFPKATLKIFSTGSITVTAASVANVQAAIEHIFPLVYEFRKKRSPEELEQLRIKQRNAAIVDTTELEEVLNDNIVVESTQSVPILQRRRLSNSAINNFKQKRRRLCNGSDAELYGEAGSLLADEGVDDPVAKENDDNIVMYDPDDLIEGPDDEDENL